MSASQAERREFESHRPLPKNSRTICRFQELVSSSVSQILGMTASKFFPGKHPSVSGLYAPTAALRCRGLTPEVLGFFCAGEDGVLQVALVEKLVERFGGTTVAGVKISADHGTLRLRWSYGGKRYQKSVGMEDTTANRRALSGRVAQIERDIAYGEFDPTLQAYRTSEAPPKKKEPEIAHLWRTWLATKKNLGVKTLQWMSTMENAIEKCPHKFPSEARLMKLWLMDNVAPPTAHRTLQNLSAMGRWAVDQHLLEKDPFDGMCNSVKVARADDENTIDPFTLAERHAILQATSVASRHNTLHFRVSGHTCHPNHKITVLADNQLNISQLV